MKIFVTGGAGFIGSNFITHLLGVSQEYSVVNYDKLTYAGNLANLESVAGNPRYRFIKGDICDAAAVAAAMAGCQAVIHFAAESHVDRSIYEPAPMIETNVTGTFVLLQIARKLNIEKFVHVSTDEVYGDLAPGTFADENSPLQPSSPYSASKASSDLDCQILRPHLRFSRGHHARVQQLRSFPISRKISASHDHKCAGRQTTAHIRRRQARA